MHRSLELIGAISTVVIYSASILVFIFRLMRNNKLAKWIGGIVLVMAVPLVYLWISGPQLEVSGLYYLQLGLMLLWIVVTLLLDYVFRYEFRHNIRLVVAYVVLFFAGTGGMMGVSALAGQPWITINGILFLAMAVLAFIQRAKTGY